MSLLRATPRSSTYTKIWTPAAGEATSTALAASQGARAIVLQRLKVAPFIDARTTGRSRLRDESGVHQLIVVVLTGGESSAPSMGSVLLALSLVHQLVGTSAGMLLLTSGAVKPTARASTAPSDCASSGVWGFSTVLRLEHVIRACRPVTPRMASVHHRHVLC